MTKLPPDYENILLQKLKNNDSSAFTTIFTEYYLDLVKFSYSITKSTDASEELVQDVFLKLWETRVSLIIHSSLRSYLLKTVQNSSIDWLRHASIKNKYASLVLEHPALLENDTENYIFQSELESDLLAALKKIPASYAEAFRMSRVDALNYSQIAEKLGVSVRTVEVRIGKALSLLREELKDYLFTLFLFYQISCLYDLFCSFPFI
jgi:RNA polymerase sigma-70 factor (family 1)